MARRKLVAGNWKMNGSRAALSELDAIAEAAAAHAGVDVAMAVPATLIAPAAERVPALSTIDSNPRRGGYCAPTRSATSCPELHPATSRPVRSVIGHRIRAP